MIEFTFGDKKYAVEETYDRVIQLPCGSIIRLEASLGIIPVWTATPITLPKAEVIDE